MTKIPPHRGERQALMPSTKIITGKASTAAHEEYRLQYSGEAIEVLQNTAMKGIHTMEGLNQFGLSLEGRVIIKDKDGDVEVRLFNIERVNLNVQAKKLLDMLLMKLSEKLPYGKEGIKKATLKDCRLVVTLDEFMILCSLSDRKNAREQFRKATEALFSIYMTFDYTTWEVKGKRRKSVKHHFSSYIIDGTDEVRTLDKDPVVDSRITVGFSPMLIEYLCKKYLMPVNIKIFAINPRTNPHAYTLARHLAEVYRIRMNKGQPPRISVRTLLETSCPELSSVEEVREKEHRKYWEKIYKPVQRDLDAIADTYGLVDWHYCHRNGEPLSDEELANHNFEDWLDFMIEFTLPDYPERG
mgnify:CR=1 FL=1